MTTSVPDVNTVNMSTRRQILDEARELYLEAGLAGFSMRGVAERVGVTATALYRHFASKDALLASLLGEAFATFGSYLGRALGGQTPLERFRLTGKGYVDFALDHPRDYALMFLTNCKDLGYERISEELAQRSRGTFEFVVDRAKECLDAHVFAPRDPREIGLHVWSTLHGLVSLWLLGQLHRSMDRSGFERQVELALDLIELSLTRNEPPRRR